MTKSGAAHPLPGALTIRVHLIDHVLQLGFSGVLSQGSHHRPQLLGGDSAISVLVKEGEGLLELWGKEVSESEVEEHRGVLTPPWKKAEGVSPT